jgi:Tol biopolymer transport system component
MRYGEARIGETYWSADGKSVIAQVSRDPVRNNWTLERIPVAGGKSEAVFPFTGYTVGSIEGRIIFRLPQPLNRTRREGRVTYTSSAGAHGEFHVPRGANIGNNLSAEKVMGVVSTRQEWAHIVSLADGKLRELRPGSLSSRGPAWAPDGRKIAMHDSTGGVYGITVMNADGSGARHYPVAAFPSYTRWAPDGQSLAYSTDPRPGSPPEIAVLDLATGMSRVVSVAPNATLVDYRWRADGQALLVMKWFPGHQAGPLVRQLFEAPLAGKERMLRDISVEFPKLTRGGPISGELLVLGENLNSEHFFLAPDGGSLVKMPRLELRGFNGEPGVSPDGKWVAFPARNRNGPGTNIQLVSVAGDSVRLLPIPFEISPTTFRPPFTPDGRNLILFGKAPGENVSKIYSVPLDGSAPKALATLPATSTIAGRLDLSPDGSAVVVTSVGPWTSMIYEIDVSPILKAIK